MVKKGAIRWHHWCHMTSHWSVTHCGMKRLVIFNKFCLYLDAEGRTEAGDNTSEFLCSSTPTLMVTNIWNNSDSKQTLFKLLLRLFWHTSHDCSTIKSLATSLQKMTSHWISKTMGFSQCAASVQRMLRPSISFIHTHSHTNHLPVIPVSVPVVTGLQW